jgi:hypothetical protein
MRTPRQITKGYPLDRNHKIKTKAKTNHYQTQSTQLTKMMIMKIVLLLLLAGSVSQAFVVIPQKPTTHRVATPDSPPMALSSVEQANLVQKWSALEARAEELKSNPSNVSIF